MTFFIDQLIDPHAPEHQRQAEAKGWKGALRDNIGYARHLRSATKRRSRSAVLERAWDADGEPDPCVYEELEHLYRALGDEVQAQHYGQKFKATAS